MFGVRLFVRMLLKRELCVHRRECPRIGETFWGLCLWPPRPRALAGGVSVGAEVEVRP